MRDDDDEDDGAHVEAKNRFDLALTVSLCLRFSEDAVAKCERAERALEHARAQRSALCDELGHVERRLANSEPVDLVELRELRARVDDAHGEVIRNVIESAKALEYMRRTTATLEQSIRLQAMGRI